MTAQCSVDGKTYVFGVLKNDIKELKLPYPTTKYKIKIRPDEFARIFLKDEKGNIEERLLITVSAGVYGVSNTVIASNIRGI